MEFDFLPKLPKSNLDDRTYQDLVEECLLRIPRYCPEWTDYNPSDPGITLIELFAWLTDQMLFRFNQVPRRNYVAFLELLGIRLHPPTPAVGEVTFYLTASRSEPYTIPIDTEVATPRTEKEEAVVFSTSQPLVIGIPKIRHLLTAQTPEIQSENLRDRLSNYWDKQTNGEWNGPELNVFEEPPQAGNCFYLILEPEDSLQGNVIAITCKGPVATSTGIDPSNPPRRWEAWNGDDWEEVLLQESDDFSDGLSFNQIARDGGDSLTGADVILHLPPKLPKVQQDNYLGYWLRCVYTPLQNQQSAYVRSPRITGLSVRSLGGTVKISQSIRINQELLGKSDGTSGQTFRLQATPILPRQEDEYILITPPEGNGLPQRWQEVNDFANSGPNDFHYTLDSLTGIIQFGPLIREATQLQEKTQWRSHLQKGTQISPEREPLEKQRLERQYGAVPPRGAIISMVSYRIGGGPQGNVKKKAITIVKSAIPYVAELINHKPTYNGASAESLEDLVIRVPHLLRTQNRAVTAEDFETLVMDAGQGAIARVRCLFPQEKETVNNSATLHGTQSLIREIERHQTTSENLDFVKLPLPLLEQIKDYLTQSSRGGGKSGQVRLLLVGKGDLGDIEREKGIHPDSLTIRPELLKQIQSYLDQRRLLGVEVFYEQPNYVGVSVQTEVALEKAYNTPSAKNELLKKINIALYRFLNPITGGIEGKGWEFGRPVYSSDIVKLLQTIEGVRYLGTVQLFELRKNDSGWERHLPREPKIEPGPLGLICSWRDDRLRSTHEIGVMPTYG